MCILTIPWELGEDNVHRHILNIRKAILSLHAQQGVTLHGMEPDILTHFLSGYFPFGLGLRQDD